MTAFCRDQCRLHASMTGTNDKYMLLIPGRRQRLFMFETDIGIHGAANRLAIARPPEATLKIADTGTDLAVLIVTAFVGPFGIGNYGTGYTHHRAVTLRNHTTRKDRSQEPTSNDPGVTQ